MIKKITKEKYLDCGPYCLRPGGHCESVREGRRRCLAVPCRFQYLKIEFEKDLAQAQRVAV